LLPGAAGIVKLQGQFVEQLITDLRITEQPSSLGCGQLVPSGDLSIPRI
jgi:hypothetical protein